MEKKYSRSHIGEVHRTKENLGSYSCKIIDGSNKPGYCTIQIGNYIAERTFNNVKKGKIKSPYHPSVYNTGYLGGGCYSCTKDAKVYKTWSGMLERCYDPKLHKKYPTYNGITVCKEWHNFQNFAKWFYEESNYQEGWHLDKDLLSKKDNKKYSPKTCIFIPQALNSFMTNTKLDNTSGCTGVSFDSKRNRWVAQIHKNNKYTMIGRYKNKSIATLQYKMARKKEADKWKEKMISILPQKAINNIK